MAAAVPPAPVVALMYDDEWDDEGPIVGPPMPAEVIETENPVVAELLGPDGAPIRQWRERRTVPVGFQRPTRRRRLQGRA